MTALPSVGVFDRHAYIQYSHKFPALFKSFSDLHVISKKNPNILNILNEYIAFLIFFMAAGIQTGKPGLFFF